MIFGIGEWLAERLWTPGNIILEEWASLIDISLIIILPLILVFTFAVYLGFYYRSVKLQSWDRVFSLRRPWVISIIAVLITQIFFCFIVALGIFSSLSLPALVGTLSLSFFEGIIGMFIYWVLSFFIYPDRGKFFPFLSSKIH